MSDSRFSDKKSKHMHGLHDAKKGKKKSKKKQNDKEFEKPIKGQGKFLESKQMVFTDMQMLVPSNKSKDRYPYNNSGDMYRGEQGPHDLKPVLGIEDGMDSSRSPGIALSNNPERLFEHNDIRRVMDEMDDDKRELLERLSKSDEDILQYLNSTMLENEPTEVLIKCAEILRERRQNLYPENKAQEAGDPPKAQ